MLTLRNYNAIPILNRAADVIKAEMESINPVRLWEICTSADSFDDAAERTGVIRNGNTSGGVGWLQLPEGGERFVGKVGGRWDSVQQMRVHLGVAITGPCLDSQMTKDDYFMSCYEKSREIALKYQDWQDENGEALATDTNLTNAGMRPMRLANGQRLMTFSYYMNINYPFWLEDA